MAILDSFFNVIGAITGFIRETTKLITVNYYNIVLLLLAIFGAYFIWKKYPTINNRYVIFTLYALILFLVLRFI
jgi:hypothetical protein